MKIKILKFQEGGQAPTQDQQTSDQSQGQSQDPMEQIIQAAAQAVQAKDPNMALQVCEALVQLVQQSQSGGEQPQQAPTYQRNGGTLKRVR